MGNIVNRVFDSSGPEGKVRGTPQQIIEKYNQLARDAQLSNDRVAAENFQQHAEHYARLLGEAQREQDARREQQEAQQSRDRQPQQRDRGGQQDGGSQAQPGGGKDGAAQADGSDVIDMGGQESGLVETPEEKPAPRKRGPRKPKPESDEAQQDSAEGAPQAPAAE